MNVSDADRTAMLEQLNAYLDGELPADESRRVEERLAADAAWAAELKRLQRAWDLLDRLPKAEVNPDFTQTTVEMIAVEAAEDLDEIEKPRPQRRRLDRLLVAGGIAAAAIAGFLAVETWRPHRDDAVLRELPVLRHYDVYGRTEKGETAEFFRLLRDAKLLTTETRRDET